MRYASIGKQPRREVNIPELSGGMNLRDSVTMINDNQLTDCKNMWFKDGMLRTRPSFTALNDTIQVSRVTSEREILGVKKFPDIVNGDMMLVSLAKMEDNLDSTMRETVYFWWQGKEGITNLYWTSPESDGQQEYFVVEKDGVLYCYFSDGTIKKINYLNEKAEWSSISEDEMYVPTVMTHGLRTGVYGYEGVQFEGYNLLGPRFKVIYSAYNENDSDKQHPMRYNFGTEIAAEGTVKVNLSYVDGNGNLQTATHTIDASGLAQKTYVSEGEIKEDGLCAYIHKEYLGFSENTDSGNQPVYKLDTESKVNKYGIIEDNVVITATAAKKDNKSEKVFKMTQSVWFGGSANGISKGSRLFLCGNTSENEKSLVIWSGLDQPLYFSENNYAYIGNKAQPTTGFGKQGENLIIFKPNETYYSYYVQNTNITAEDLINQNVVDYSANNVYFPMVSLHSSIGCDCPNTIQLCRNRLVWANSDGKVYTLVSANQYSEMTIYPVSEMIERKIKEAVYDKSQLKAASSHDFDGHYVLIIGSDAYVMDYNCYGYSHIYGYSKTEDANILIPWYYWRLLPERIATHDMDTKPQYYGFGDFIAGTYYLEGAAYDGSKICTCILKTDNTDSKDTYLQLDDRDNAVVKASTFTSSLQTKLFDFSAANYYKNVDRVSLMLGNNGVVPITVQFVTDAGCEQETVMLNDNELTPFTAGYVNVQSFNPSIRSVIRFAVRLESEGLLAVDGMNLLYRLLGGVR